MKNGACLSEEEESRPMSKSSAPRSQPGQERQSLLESLEGLGAAHARLSGGSPLRPEICAMEDEMSF